MDGTIFFKTAEIKAIGLKDEDGFLCASWEISPQLIYFEGHFPHFPVLPAVAIVDACLAFLNAAPLTASNLNQSFHLLQVPSAKFLQPLPPGYKVRIVARPSSPDVWDFEWAEPESLEVVAQVRLCVGGK